VNRGYRREVLRENGHLKEFTAACSPHIYRGGLYPAEFDDNAFICEPAGNLIKREILTAANGTLSAKEAYHQRDFMASTDERFRPVHLTSGPDGALYVTDFYRGVLQHRESFTTCASIPRNGPRPAAASWPHLAHRARGAKPSGKPALSKETPGQRPPVERQQLVARDGVAFAGRTERCVSRTGASTGHSGAETMGRVHALTLDGLTNSMKPP
jgi:hypothetical protein